MMQMKMLSNLILKRRRRRRALPSARVHPGGGLSGPNITVGAGRKGRGTETIHFLLDGDDLFAAAGTFGGEDGRVQELEEVEVVVCVEGVEEGFCVKTSAHISLTIFDRRAEDVRMT